MISSGFHGVYSELGPAFERATGHHLITIRGPSIGDSPEAIPARLTRGESADVVILDGGAADDLGRRGLVRAETKVELARSQVGMVVMTGDASPDVRRRPHQRRPQSRGGQCVDPLSCIATSQCGHRQGRPHACRRTVAGANARRCLITRRRAAQDGRASPGPARSQGLRVGRTPALLPLKQLHRFPDCIFHQARLAIAEARHGAVREVGVPAFSHQLLGLAVHVSPRGAAHAAIRLESSRKIDEKKRSMLTFAKLNIKRPWLNDCLH